MKTVHIASTEDCFAQIVREGNDIFDRQVDPELFGTNPSTSTIHALTWSENVQAGDGVFTAEHDVPGLSTTAFELSFCSADVIHNSLADVSNGSGSADHSPD